MGTAFAVSREMTKTREVSMMKRVKTQQGKLIRPETHTSYSPKA
jgi:hypothetical protein